MTWCNSCGDEPEIVRNSTSPADIIDEKSQIVNVIKSCPSCGHSIKFQEQAAAISEYLPGLPAGVKFDPTDQELLEHLEGKVRSDTRKLHPLIDEFIPTLDGENGICYTHPEKLPGVSRDGQMRHFFHQPSMAYTTGTRKRRKVHTDEHGGETRWHKTGKTRPVFATGKKVMMGQKKILVLYTNYGKKRKPEKTNWVMHQYHIGSNEEEKDGELVVSKVFYQTQPRQCGRSSSSAKDDPVHAKSESGHLNGKDNLILVKDPGINGEYCDPPPLVSYSVHGRSRPSSSPQLIPSFSVHAHGPSFLP